VDVLPRRTLACTAWSDTAPALDVAQSRTDDNAQVVVYRPARTAADCFKFRNRVGIDVAVEALREALRKRLGARPEIDRFAAICRVSRVMRPYLESLFTSASAHAQLDRGI
jgi:hypothetical protein